MAKLSELSEDNVKIVNDVIDERDLNRYMEFKLFSISKMATVIKVNKASAQTEAIAKKQDLCVITIYEEAFDRLDEPSKKLIVENAISQVGYDTEKGRIIITQPDICVTSGARQIYGDALLNAVESSSLAIQQIADEEKERKESKKRGSKNAEQ